MNAAGHLRRERSLVVVVLLCAALTLSHFVRVGWYWVVLTAHSADPFATPHPLYAPAAYRVAIPWLTRVTAGVLHVHNFPSVAAGLDFVFCFAALYVLYLVLTESEALPGSRRMLCVVLFLASLQLPLNWVVPWQRQETLPSALYLAVSLVCLMRLRTSGFWTVLLLVLAVVQAFVRADVPFAFGGAVALLSVLTPWLNDLASRQRCVTLGAAIVAIAGAAQWYLSHVRFPHLSYPPDTPRFTLSYNLAPHNLNSLFVALIPFVLLAAVCVYARAHLSSIDRLIITAALLYVPFWLCLGLADEVRIFVPFMLALCVPAAHVLTTLLLPVESQVPTTDTCNVSAR